MPYSAITSNRIPYDIDGTKLYYKNAVDISAWDIRSASVLTNSQLTELNDEDITVTIGTDYVTRATMFFNLWIFLPEKKTINAMYVGGFSLNMGVSPVTLVSFQGSNNTTDGMDGTWETATFPNGSPVTFDPISASWRANIRTVNFTSPYQTVRILLSSYSSWASEGAQVRLATVHLYGPKAVGEHLDDLTFCEADGTEITAVNDFQERPEASTVTDSFKIKNVSPDKTATAININVTHADFLLSLSESGPWTASLDFASLAPSVLTETIYIKNELGQPQLILGPKATRIVTTIGSWV